MNNKYKLLTALVSVQLFAMNIDDVRSLPSTEVDTNVKSYLASEDPSRFTTADIGAAGGHSNQAETNKQSSASETPMEEVDHFELEESHDRVVYYLKKAEPPVTHSVYDRTVPSLDGRESIENIRAHADPTVVQYIRGQRTNRTNELAEKMAEMLAEHNALEQTDMTDNEYLDRVQISTDEQSIFSPFHHLELENRAERVINSTKKQYDVELGILSEMQVSLSITSSRIYDIQITEEPFTRESTESEHELELAKLQIADTLLQDKINSLPSMRSEEHEEWNALYSSLNTMYRVAFDKDNNARFNKLEKLLMDSMSREKSLEQNNNNLKNKVNELENSNNNLNNKVAKNELTLFELKNKATRVEKRINSLDEVLRSVQHKVVIVIDKVETLEDDFYNNTDDYNNTY